MSFPILPRSDYCLRVIRSPDRAQHWCLLRAGHRNAELKDGSPNPDYEPDCAGVAPSELPLNDLGPKWRPGW